MTQMNMVQAINDALRLEMRRDERVVVLGEDVGKVGGVFRVTAGPLRRVRRRPRHRHAALRGRHHRHRDRHGALRPRAGPRDPVRRLHLPGVRPDLSASSRSIATARAASTRRSWSSARRSAAASAAGTITRSRPRRSSSTSPGSRSSARRTRTTRRACLLASIRDPDPVLFFEPKRIYRAAKGDVPEGDYTVPLGKAAVVREGKHVTIIAWGAMLYEALDAAEQGGRAGHRRARSSICARSGRSTSRPSSRASRRPAASSSSTRRRRRCGFGARDRRARQREGVPPPRGAAGARHRLRHAVPVHAREEYLPLAHRILPALVETARY